MKNKILLFIVISFFTGGVIGHSVCNGIHRHNSLEVAKKDSIINVQLDTIDFYKRAYHYVDSELVYITDSLKAYNALDYKYQIDSLKSDLFVSNYKLGRIQEYCNIVERNSTQLKYLRGWINRVLED